MIRDILGIVGTIISVVLFLSPGSTMWKIYKRKSVEEFSAVPYLATFLNCCLWTLYALPFVKPNSISVLVTNAIGIGLEIIYLIIYINFSTTWKARLKVLAIWIVEIIIFAAIALGVLLGTHDYQKRAKIVGAIAIALNIIMYASPLTIMKMVIQTKSVEYMPLYISVACFLNGVIWTSYAFLPFDLNIVVPNGLGILLCLAQLGLYACYYKSTPKDHKSIELERTNNV